MAKKSHTEKQEVKVQAYPVELGIWEASGTGLCS